MIYSCKGICRIHRFAPFISHLSGTIIQGIGDEANNYLKHIRDETRKQTAFELAQAFN